MVEVPAPTVSVRPLTVSPPFRVTLLATPLSAPDSVTLCVLLITTSSSDVGTPSLQFPPVFHSEVAARPVNVLVAASAEAGSMASAASAATSEQAVRAVLGTRAPEVDRPRQRE